MRVMNFVAGLLAGACLIAPPAQAADPAKAKSGGDLIYFGTRANVIHAARFDPLTGRLSPLGQVAALEGPTWLIPDPKARVIYAVNEIGNDGKAEGGVTSLAYDPQTAKLTVLNRVGAVGGGATHLTIDAPSRTLFVSNFGTGHVAAIPFGVDGHLAPATSSFQEVGSGPNPRQVSAHAHGTALDPSGRYLLSADVGADRIFVYRFDRAGRRLVHDPAADLATPPGTGPRHLVFSPNGRFVYAVSELSVETLAYRWDARRGRLEPLQTLAGKSPGAPPTSQGGEIAISRDGRFLYATVRGEDVLVVYAVDSASGRLTEVQRIPAGAKVPWYIAFDPSQRWLLMAGNPSTTVRVFKRDAKTGMLSATENSLEVPQPTTVTFVPGRR